MTMTPTQKLLYGCLALGILCIVIGLYSGTKESSSPALAVVPPSPTSTPSVIPTIMVTVNAQRMWTDTDIQVKEGDIITIEATGEVNGGVRTVEANRWVGPDGWDSPPQVTGQAAWVLGSNSSYMCLIGRLGNGRPFKIGRKHSFTATGNGNLSFGVNDEIVDEYGKPISGGIAWNDNAGLFDVRVHIIKR